MLAAACYLLLGLLALIAALVAYASRRPAAFNVSRSQVVNAPPERIFPLIDDLRQMNTWNPYALREPSMRQSYRGAENGVGAIYEFDGRKSGSGRIEIIDHDPPRRVTMRLAMLKPMKADNTVTFTLEPQGPATVVTWAMTGRTPLLGKVLHTLMDMDKMVGRDFADGLARLKAIAENPRV